MTDTNLLTQHVLPRTVALYQRDEGLRTHITRVAAILSPTALSEPDRSLFKNATDEDRVLVTTETIFYAQGGGQPCDTGVMESKNPDGKSSIFQVSSVRNASKGQILHLGRFRGSEFARGDTVLQTIDGARRTLNSRIHTGGHVVGLAVRHLAKDIPNVVELKAQHHPEIAFVDFQGSIDGKHKDAIQAKVDELIRRALPVKVYFWNERELREKCAVVPTAVAIPEDDLIRAVDIEDAGAYPCGGTHVPNTSLIGKVKIKKISRSKGNSKISYITDS